MFVLNRLKGISKFVCLIAAFFFYTRNIKEQQLINLTSTKITTSLIFNTQAKALSLQPGIS